MGVEVASNMSKAISMKYSCLPIILSRPVYNAVFYIEMSVRNYANAFLRYHVVNRFSEALSKPPPTRPWLTIHNSKGKREYLVISVGCHCDQQLSLIFPIQMGPINTDNRLTVFESWYAWTKRPKYIMQQYGVIFIGGCDTIQHLGSRVLINICH